MVVLTYGLFVESDVATIENLKRDNKGYIAADLDTALFCLSDKKSMQSIQQSVDRLVLQNTFDNPDEKEKRGKDGGRGQKRSQKPK